MSPGINSYEHLKYNSTYKPLHIISHTKAIIKNENPAKEGRELSQLAILLTSLCSNKTPYYISRDEASEREREATE